MASCSPHGAAPERPAAPAAAAPAAAAAESRRRQLRAFYRMAASELRAGRRDSTASGMETLAAFFANVKQVIFQHKSNYHVTFHQS